MSEHEKDQSTRAEQYAKEHGKAIAARLTKNFQAEENPVSIFMAGSPGAGKTETSKRLIKATQKILRIDADEFRDHFKKHGYDGRNSHLFQKAATKLVHEIHDQALKKGISFLLDGTLANGDMARQNIKRSLKRKRDVFIMFVYQPPMSAWRFVQEREVVERRRIRAEDFAQKFCAAHDVANKMKAEFGGEIVLRLLCKNIDGSDRFYEKNIQRIDDHISDKYNEQEILSMIKDELLPLKGF